MRPAGKAKLANELGNLYRNGTRVQVLLGRFHGRRSIWCPVQHDLFHFCCEGYSEAVIQFDRLAVALSPSDDTVEMIVLQLSDANRNRT